MDFTNTKIGTKNLNVLGPMQVVRANTSFEFDYDIMDTVEVAGWTFILTEVVEWPFSDDDAGTPFDTGAIVGVRTRCWRRPIADGGGDMEWYTAVPKELPADYTSVNRGGGLLGDGGFYADYLGEDPMLGTTWNLRTPTGRLLTSTNDPDGYRAKWTPMNLNQQVVGSDISDVFSGQWVPYYNAITDPNPVYWVAALASDHIGFRGGTLVSTLTATTMSTNFPNSGTRPLEIIAVSVEDYWDPTDADGTSGVVEVLTSETIPWSFAAPASPPTITNFTLGDMRPATPGIRRNFFIRFEHIVPGPGENPAPIFRCSYVFQLSPRTDVPLWYSASTGNVIAPGGYIEP